MRNRYWPFLYTFKTKANQFIRWSLNYWARLSSNILLLTGFTDLNQCEQTMTLCLLTDGSGSVHDSVSGCGEISEWKPPSCAEKTGRGIKTWDAGRGRRSAGLNGMNVGPWPALPLLPEPQPPVGWQPPNPPPGTSSAHQLENHSHSYPLLSKICALKLDHTNFVGRIGADHIQNFLSEGWLVEMNRDCQISMHIYQ